MFYHIKHEDSACSCKYMHMDASYLSMKISSLYTHNIFIIDRSENVSPCDWETGH